MTLHAWFYSIVACTPPSSLSLNWKVRGQKRACTILLGTFSSPPWSSYALWSTDTLIVIWPAVQSSPDASKYWACVSTAEAGTISLKAILNPQFESTVWPSLTKLLLGRYIKTLPKMVSGWKSHIVTFLTTGPVSVQEYIVCFWMLNVCFVAPKVFHRWISYKWSFHFLRLLTF